MNKFLDRIIPFGNKLANFAIWYFIVGMIYIHVRATFLPYEQTIWDDLYYIWNNGLFLLLFILVRCFVIDKYRSSFNPIIFYSLIRFLWEVASPITNRVEVNHPTATTVLFSILLTGAIILLLADLKKRYRDGN